MVSHWRCQHWMMTRRKYWYWHLSTIIVFIIRVPIVSMDISCSPFDTVHVSHCDGIFKLIFPHIYKIEITRKCGEKKMNWNYISYRLLQALLRVSVWCAAAMWVENFYQDFQMTLTTIPRHLNQLMLRSVVYFASRTCLSCEINWSDCFVSLFSISVY